MELKKGIDPNPDYMYIMPYITKIAICVMGTLCHCDKKNTEEDRGILFTGNIKSALNV